MAVAVGRYTRTKRKMALAMRVQCSQADAGSGSPLLLVSSHKSASVNQDDNACDDHSIKKDRMAAAHIRE